MKPDEAAFGAALADAVARDAADHPPKGPLVRVVLRWFEGDRPTYFTVHALGADERDAIPPEDAWHPLEWETVERELDRTDRVGEDAEVQATGAALEGRYEAEVEALEEDEEDAYFEALSPPPAIVEAVRLLPEALRRAAVPLHDDFATSAAHFEGYGAGDVLERTASPEVLAVLRERGELPDE